MMGPIPTQSEKKHCSTACRHTSGSSILFHCGVRKYLIPFQAPGRVTARPIIIRMTIYGKIARKYATFPELLIPRDMTRNIIIHATNKHNVNFHSGQPIPSSMLSFSCKTTFLQIVYSIN